MGEESSQGITRRDLLRRGAVLGGAVVWTTPVVQTLGMGRAFAQTASPTGGQAISYIGINVTGCSVNGAPFFAKWEDGGGWEDSPGAAPSCADKSALPEGVEGTGKGFQVTGSGDSCKDLFVPAEYSTCTVTVWVKAGQNCRTYTNADLNFGGNTTVCSTVT